MHIVIGLVIALAIVALFARRRMGKRYCRWRQDRREARWICVYCGATSASKPDKCLNPGVST